MKLNTIKSKNFMPYKGEMEIAFPADEQRNVMIVLGDNMRGKTSLLNAIRWGFYGKAIGRHSRQIPLHEIVNVDATKEDDWSVEVFLTFEAKGTQYQLRRRAVRKRHVVTPTRDDDFDVSIHLTRDGSVISGDQIDAEINQVAPEQVSRFFLFDGELLQEYEELLVEGSQQGSQIKEAIEQVLGVPALTNGRHQLSAILKNATKQQSRDLAQIAGLKGQAEKTQALTTKLESFEKDLGILNDKLDATRDERTSLDDELEAAARLLALQSKLEAARSKRSENLEILEIKSGERQAVLSQAWKDVLHNRVEAKRQILKERLADATTRLQVSARLSAKIDDLRRARDSRQCPTCHQDYPATRRERLGEELGKAEIELAEMEQDHVDISAISAELSLLDRIKPTGASERIAAIDKDIRRAEIGIQKAENEIEDYEEQISGHDTAELARKRILRDEKLREEARLGQDIKRCKASIEETEQDLAIARKATENLASARGQASTEKVKITAALATVFAESIEALRDRLREKVENLASESFRQMTTQSAYQGLQINENYGLSILDSQGRTVKLRSAGAEQIVALALIDGLNRTGRAIGPVVMDTPFARLDPKHRSNVLNHLPTVTSQFIILVHGGEINADVDLATVKPRIGATYRISEISERQSKIERAQL